MKKTLVLFITVFMLLCSCSSTKFSHMFTPDFAMFGEEGEIILSGNAKYFLPNVPCLDNVTLVFKDDDLYGILEGKYTKSVIERIVRHSDIKFNDYSDFSYCYTGVGKTFFSTSDANSQYADRVVKGDVLISSEDVKRIKNAEDFAIYAKRPDIGYKNIDKLMLLKNTDSFDFLLYFDDNTSAASFFRLLKNDFYLFEIKDNISSDLIFEQIEEHFFVSDNIVYILELSANRYLENWVRRIFSYGIN